MTHRLVLFHWSPSMRRKSIDRRGLEPGHWSTDRLWKPPYIAYADNPELAWILSGKMPRGLEHALWDLWLVNADDLPGYEVLPFDADSASAGYVKEYRVYFRVPKRHVTYIGSRYSGQQPRIVVPS